MAGFKVGDQVIYGNDGLYYIIAGPIMSTKGPIYTISRTPPPIQGVVESDLQLAPG